MQMNKKGEISPLVATVVIIGFTVSMVALIMVWGNAFIEGMQEPTLEPIYEESETPKSLVFYYGFFNKDIYYVQIPFELAPYERYNLVDILDERLPRINGELPGESYCFKGRHYDGRPGHLCNAYYNYQECTINREQLCSHLDIGKIIIEQEEENIRYNLNAEHPDEFVFQNLRDTTQKMIVHIKIYELAAKLKN